jgi:TolB-like protein/Tfp pilus assembly protein PilF
VKIDNGAGGSRETSTDGPGSRPGWSAVDKRGRESINFFAELKRRNVYKVAVAYAVAGWALAQGIAQVFPVFDIPNWVVRLIVLLIIIGLPIALGLAWAFEVTPEGIKRTEAADAAGQHSRGHTWIYIVIVAAAFSIGLFFLGRYSAGNKTTSPAGISNKSIAVLPFENLSRDPENAYFADGIQDEVLSMVAKIGDLKVISRTSTAKYKSKPESLRQVGLELGVANLLEGSVQKAGDRVRVIVQLIDAGSDNHVWSETYDRELKDVFGVQSEIAQSIATALRAKLSANETHSLGELPTRDPEAYQAYLKAGYFQREATSRNGDPAILLPQALDLYSAAITRDPSFALAWAKMSYIHSWVYWFGVDNSPDQVRLAEESAQRAISLDPQLGEAHLAAGYVAYWGRRDYATGMKEFEVARKLLPNNPDVSIAIGSVCRRRGDWATAIKEFKRAASLDPRDAQLSTENGYLLGFCKHYGEALQAMERALTIQPDHWDALCGSAMIALASHGDIAQANALMARVPASVDPQGQVRFVRYKIALRTRDFAKAVAVLDGAPDWILTDPVHRPVATAGLRGVALEAVGDTAAHREFEAAIRLLEKEIRSGRSEPSIHAALGRAYAGLDRRNDAVSEGTKAIELLPVSQDAFDGTFYLQQFAEIQARVGNTDEALSAIRQLLDLSAGLMMSPALLRLDPVWDPIRNDPGFQQLLTGQEHVGP